MNKTVKKLIEDAHYKGQLHSEIYLVTRNSAKEYADRVEKDFDEMTKGE